MFATKNEKFESLRALIDLPFEKTSARAMMPFKGERRAEGLEAIPAHAGNSKAINALSIAKTQHSLVL
jgi:hypothetical protein